MCFLVWYLSLSINLQECTSRNTSNDSSRKHWNSADNKQPLLLPRAREAKQLLPAGHRGAPGGRSDGAEAAGPS